MNDTDTKTLAPCPFCGGFAGLGTGENYRFVNCIDCLATVGDLGGDALQLTEEEAIEVWNTRTESKEIENLESAIKVLGEINDINEETEARHVERIAGLVQVLEDCETALICNEYDEKYLLYKEVKAALTNT